MQNKETLVEQNSVSNLKEAIDLKEQYAQKVKESVEETDFLKKKLTSQSDVISDLSSQIEHLRQEKEKLR